MRSSNEFSVHSSRISSLHLRLIGRTSPIERLYLGGTFDCLHRGHLKLFENACKVSDTLIVSLNTDDFAESYKRRPLMSLEDRFAVLTHCDLVDEVIINDGGADSRPAIEASRATAIGHGDDWVGATLMKQLGITQEWLMDKKIAMIYLPYTQGISTSEILSSIPTGRVIFPPIKEGT